MTRHPSLAHDYVEQLAIISNVDNKVSPYLLRCSFNVRRYYTVPGYSDAPMAPKNHSQLRVTITTTLAELSDS